MFVNNNTDIDVDITCVSHPKFAERAIFKNHTEIERE